MSKSLKAIDELFLKRHGAVETEEGTFEINDYTILDDSGNPIPWKLVTILTTSYVENQDAWDVCLGDDLIFSAKSLVSALMYIGVYKERYALEQYIKEKSLIDYRATVGGAWA